jgi:alpha-galactosidase/6-phospho-beta-glucosidase family protein
MEGEAGRSCVEDSGLRVSILAAGRPNPGLIEGFIRQKSKIPLERLVLMDIDGAKCRAWAVL